MRHISYEAKAGCAGNVTHGRAIGESVVAPMFDLLEQMLSGHDERFWLVNFSDALVTGNGTSGAIDTDFGAAI